MFNCAIGDDDAKSKKGPRLSISIQPTPCFITRPPELSIVQRLEKQLLEWTERAGSGSRSCWKTVFQWRIHAWTVSHRSGS
jgi:hypothetical protein